MEVPTPDWINVNTNRAMSGSLGIAGCGGIFKRLEDSAKGCFVKPSRVLYAFEAELWGVITTVKYAISFKWTHLWFECDATYIVNLLQTKSRNIPWKFLSRWGRELNFLAGITYCVSHVFREVNRMADK